MKPDESKEVEKKEKGSVIETRRVLEFKCPTCGSHKLDHLDASPMPAQEVTKIYDDLIMLGKSAELENVGAWYRCHDCAAPLGDRGPGTLPWKGTSELVQWLMEHCEQSPETILKVDRWYEGDNASEEVKTKLQEEGFASNYVQISSGWQMERWGRLDGKYRLIAIHGSGLYIAEDVESMIWEPLSYIAFYIDVPRWAQTERLVDLRPEFPQV